MGTFGVGQSVLRVEDRRFLTGTGRFTDDINKPGQLHLYVLRSPHAHADIKKLDVSAAKSAPGVVGVLTIDDLDALKIGGVPTLGAMPDKNGNRPAPPPRPILARGRVRYVGEPVAAVIADTLTNARDASELIDIDYAELPVAATLATAAAPGAPQIYPQFPGNMLVHWQMGDEAATNAAFAKADKIVRIDLVNNRISPTAMEPRAAIAEYDPQSQRYTLTHGTQGGHGHQKRFAPVLGVDAKQVRVITPDVGGAFGMKNAIFNEPLLCLVAAKHYGKPVKWTGDRSESFLNDTHARDQINHAELALTKDGRFLAIRVSSLGSVGAYLSLFGCMIPTSAGGGMLCGAYQMEAACVDVKVIFSNSAPVEAYRGAGRPEAAYVVERLVEQAARELGVPSTELRRKNFIRPEQFPYKTAFGHTYDSGRYEEVMDAALKRADVAGLAARKAEAAKRGKLRGLGVCYYIEACAGIGQEQPHIAFDRAGKLTIKIGTQSNGQGHETVYAQIAAAEFGIPIEDITVIQGDTDIVPTGDGTGGSRSIPVGGSAVQQTVVKMIEQGKAIAAELLEVAAVDVELSEGKFRVAGTDRAVNLKDVIAASFDANKRPQGTAEGLYAAETFKANGSTFPNGCHLCEVDVDPETGTIEFVRYTIQDDLGVAINPLTMTGQIYGGAVQGIGQALFEESVYDDNGQLLTGSFMDYCMPRADNTPSFDFAYTEVPTPRNSLGAKGAGEAGTIGATPAAVNAVIDALSPLGITHLDMPLTPLKVWQAIQAAKTKAA